MISLSAEIRRFKNNKEKTGWHYVEITQSIAARLAPGKKGAFRVKGFIDDVQIAQRSLIPVGRGAFIIPLKNDLRKMLRKKEGDSVRLRIESDHSLLKINDDLLDCLKEEAVAMEFFESLTPSHRRYFSSWIESAKTDPTKVKRIACALSALSRKMGFAEMMREKK